ncbi:MULTISPECIES: hypothetical protein [unclassified Minwuia]|uniref:bifunctional folylpolyglutamate synthase/dihydrofolate synthase n=1 Tax=unclassified Minwuia TaxID=2618799 RepID=UPI00247A5856|nr:MULTISPECIES: hypothetical protein [unclassified Minwuia]
MRTPLTDAALDRITRLGARRMELDLERLPTLLERLGAPHRRLPPVVHITGTNGKGSVVACLNAMLSRQGLRVQRYISPYLSRPTEQVLLPDGEIADAVYAQALTRVADVNDGAPLPVFEAMTAAAFLCFAESPADVLLLECGMGGRLDCTNTVPDVCVSVMTPVALDHQAFLGPDTTSIAREKAGIFRAGVPVVANPQDVDAIAVAHAATRALGCPLHLAGRDWSIDGESGAYAGESDLVLPRPGLTGQHQWQNAAQAVAVMEVLARRAPAVRAPDSETVAAIADVRLSARFHQVRHPDASRRIWVDGGHNVHAAEAAAAALAAMPSQPLTLIVGILDNRPVAPFLSAFAHLDPTVIGVPIQHQPVYAVGTPTAPEKIAAIARDLGLSGRHAPDWQQALEQSDPRRQVLITGSLYLVGEVLQTLPPC